MSGIRVLIVDDDPSFVATAVRALGAGSPSFDVTTAGTGGDGAALLARAASGEIPSPNLVLLDYHLPDTTAPALLRQIAVHPSLTGVPILVLTLEEQESAREDALRAGATGFAAKPSRVQALREIILRFWETHGQPSDDPDHR